MFTGVLAGLTANFAARAADGVAEINQTCATTTGCFANDSPGFPVSITGSAGRSYRLTSDLVLPNQNTTGISVSAPDVTIDLAGFSIRGIVACSGTPLVCTPSSGQGYGIQGLTDADRLTVSDGSVMGMGIDGIDSDGAGCTIRNVRASSNAGVGIDPSTGGSAVLIGNVAESNGLYGFASGVNAVVSKNVVRLNGNSGIVTGSGSSIEGNTVYSNGTNGISAGAGNIVRDNAVYDNGADGLATSLGARVIDNNAYLNEGNGIVAGARSFLSGNISNDNGATGLVLGDDSAYRENLITSNVGAAVTISSGTVFNLGLNACTDTVNATITCP